MHLYNMTDIQRFTLVPSQLSHSRNLFFLAFLLSKCTYTCTVCIFVIPMIKSTAQDLHLYIVRMMISQEFEFNTSIVCRTMHSAISFYLPPERKRIKRIRFVWSVMEDKREEKSDLYNLFTLLASQRPYTVAISTPFSSFSIIFSPHLLTFQASSIFLLPPRPFVRQVQISSLLKRRRGFHFGN